ncbi:regulator of Vps4 activity in the MVB pathway-domain-containing protein [Paraphysoderma sedebokerense]|nr:regulator of Vps4 activity in the MVB pathway-domain-containing protein [Paraphysoderma sedebokerense]
MPTLGFNANRLKVHLRLSINRLKLLQQKKTTANKVVRKELASLLEQGKDESARIRVEHVIREDFNMEAMEVLELYCELLLARFGLIESMSACDSAISEAVNTLIYAAPRSEVKELHMVRDQLISKYGRDFAAAAMENRNEVVNPRVRCCFVPTPIFNWCFWFFSFLLGLLMWTVLNCGCYIGDSKIENSNA